MSSTDDRLNSNALIGGNLRPRGVGEEEDVEEDWMEWNLIYVVVVGKDGGILY